MNDHRTRHWFAVHKMITIISRNLILVFGIVICVMCAWGIYAPNRLINMVRTTLDKDWGIYFGVIIRLFLGVCLFLAAPDTKSPLVFRVLAAVSIVAAIVIACAGRKRISLLMTWLERFPPSTLRFWLLFGIAFGGFLIYGVL